MIRGFRGLPMVATAVVGAGLMLGVAASPAAAKKEKPAAAAAADTEHKLAPSKEYMAVYKELAAANTAKDAAALKAALDKGATLVNKADDQFLQANFGLQLGLLTKDAALQAASLDTMIDSGLAPSKDLAKFNYFSGTFAYNAKDYPKAIRRFEAAKAAGYTESALSALLMDSYLKAGQLDQALAISKAGIAAARAAGTRPMEDLYVRPAQALQKAGRTDDLMDILTLRLEDYPAPEIWRNTLYIQLQSSAGDKELALDIFRLMRATNSMTARADYLEYAANATEAGLPGEVVALINEGQASGVVPKADPRFGEILATQTTRAAGEKASLMADVSKAASLPSAKRARSSADALIGFGNYDGAITLYQAATTLPGAQPDLITYRLAQAQALGGQYAAAAQSFAKVTGARKRLADLWLVHIKQKQAPAAPAPTTTPAS